jgi:hypothetical protein
MRTSVSLIILENEMEYLKRKKGDNVCIPSLLAPPILRCENRLKRKRVDRKKRVEGLSAARAKEKIPQRRLSEGWSYRFPY